MQPRISVVLLCACLSACSSWPDAGAGGGEAGGIIAEPTYLDTLRDKEHAGLLAQSEVLDAHTQLLIVQGANGCVPAAVLQLEQQGLKVRRQLAAGLLADAADDMAVYQHQIRQVRQRFDAVRSQTQCAAAGNRPTPGQSNGVSAAPSLFTFWFDHDSAELGPGYQRHLQLIVEVIAQCNCQVHIVGHTDQQGLEPANLALAQRRVDAVQQALASRGVQASSQLALGEQEPLLRDQENQVLNRRVELILQPKRTDQAGQDSTSSLLIKQWQDAGVMQSK